MSSCEGDKDQKMRDEYNANKGELEISYDELMARIDAYANAPVSTTLY